MCVPGECTYWPALLGMKDTYLPWGGGESRAGFAFCPAQTKNAREKNVQFSEVLEFQEYPPEFGKMHKKRTKQTNFQTRNIDLHE